MLPASGLESETLYRKIQTASLIWQHLSRDQKGVREGVVWVSRGRAFKESSVQTSSQCKGPEAGADLLEDEQEAGVAEAE